MLGSQLHVAPRPERKSQDQRQEPHRDIELAVCREEDGADFHTLLAQLINQLRLLAETQNGGVKNVL